MGRLKDELRPLLRERRLDDIEAVAVESRRALGDLLALTYDADPLVAWRAVEAMGVAAARVARDHPGYVREHLRRLFWLITEESGGICWHAPEAMAEIVHRRPDLFGDYVPIVVHLLVETAEEDLVHFRAGMLWAMARLGPLAGEVPANVLEVVCAGLDDGDSGVRGMAVLCLARLGRSDILAGRSDLRSDEGRVEVFDLGELRSTTVARLLGDLVDGGSRAS